MKQTFKLPFILAAYTAAACLALAAVNMLTFPYIQKTKELKTKNALNALFPEADSFKPITEGLPKSVDKVRFSDSYIVYAGDTVLGIAVTVSGHTYDQATILTGINTAGKLVMIAFLSFTDSPGIGLKAAQEPFIGQFRQKTITDPFTPGADIQAISGATISSNAVTRIVKTAVDAAAVYMQQHNLLIPADTAGGN